MDITILGLNIIINRVPKWPPHNWTLKKRRELARHIDEVRPKVQAYEFSSPKIARIKALRDEFGWDEMPLADAKSLNELLWLDNGRGEIA